jgi:hypothetical protein
MVPEHPEIVFNQTDVQVEFHDQHRLQFGKHLGLRQSFDRRDALGVLFQKRSDFGDNLLVVDAIRFWLGGKAPGPEQKQSHDSAIE